MRWAIFALSLAICCTRRPESRQDGAGSPTDSVAVVPEDSSADVVVDQSDVAPDAVGSPDDTRDADSGDAEFDPTKGWVQNGVYKCCAQGEGTSCCSPGEPYAACVEYQPCVREGRMFDRKFICLACCTGLKPLTVTQRNDGGACELNESVPPGTAVCSKCGDGICDPNETACNCLSDCPN